MRRPAASFCRRWSAVLAAAALAAVTGLAGLGPASAAGAFPPPSVAPAHHSPGGPPSAGHGGSGAGASYGWASSNWSGYAVQAASGSAFRSVSGSWTVPAVKKPERGGYGFSAAWVGLDGFFNSPGSLIQTGTEQDFYYGSGHYSAWWTSSAQGYQEQRISGTECGPAVADCGTVAPGDAMAAAVALSGNSTGSITLSDGSLVHPWSFTTSIAYSGPGLSAEWIMEAPSSSSGVLPLANYGSTVFDPGTVDGGNPGLTASDGGYLVQDGAIASIPSAPDSDTDGFAIAYGSTAPPAPSS